MKRIVRNVALAPIRAYQRFISPALPQRCKYYPTCSAYAVDAIRELGVIRGTIVAAWRVLRCNPWSHGGYDPVENRSLFRAPPGSSSLHTAHPSGDRAESGRKAEHSARMIGSEREQRILRGC